MITVEQLRQENFKLMKELQQAAMEQDETTMEVIHEIMMNNKEMMLRLEKDNGL